MKAGSAQAESCCVYVKSEKFMQHMLDIFPKLFDCWANPVAHLLLLKSSMTKTISVIVEIASQPVKGISLQVGMIYSSMQGSLVKEACGLYLEYIHFYSSIDVDSQPLQNPRGFCNGVTKARLP